jgi:hypothetical protein
MHSNITENYINLGKKVGILVGEKQEAYGDSFGRSGAVLREMFPDGIKPEQYGDLLTIARILDKLFRLANNPGAFDESPYRDICGYALLGINRQNQKSGVEIPIPMKESETISFQDDVPPPPLT